MRKNRPEAIKNQNIDHLGIELVADIFSVVMSLSLSVTIIRRRDEETSQRSDRAKEDTFNSFQRVALTSKTPLFGKIGKTCWRSSTVMKGCSGVEIKFNDF